MPVQYKDLAKPANDLFNKNYEHGNYALEINHKAVNFDFKTKSNFKNGAVTASHEQVMDRGNCGKHKGVFKSGSATVAYDSEFKFLENKNLKINLLSDFAMGPALNVNFLKEFAAPKELKFNFSNDKVNLDLSTGFKNYKILNGALVLGEIPKVPDFTLGAKFALDFAHNFAGKNPCPFKNVELAVNKTMGPTNVNLAFRPNNNSFDLSLFSQLNDDVKLASIISHSKDNDFGFNLAGAIKGVNGTFHQFKVDQAGTVAVSHVTPTNFGPKLTVSGEFNALNVENGGKVGAGLKFDL